MSSSGASSPEAPDTGLASPDTGLARPDTELASPNIELARPARRRWRWLAGFVLIVVLDGIQPPHRQPSAVLTLGAIDLYQATLSKLMPSIGITCRFKPTCSHYAEGAIRARGTWPGAGLTAKRIARCGPWTPAGTVDPPPEPQEPQELEQ